MTSGDELYYNGHYWRLEAVKLKALLAWTAQRGLVPMGEQPKTGLRCWPPLRWYERKP